MPIIIYHVVESREAVQERRPAQRHRPRSPFLENFAGPRDDFITLEIYEPWWRHQQLFLGGVSYIGGVEISSRSGLGAVRDGRISITGLFDQVPQGA